MQAGPWLLRFAVRPVGLEAIDMRLLTEPPYASSPGKSSEFMNVLLGASTARPTAVQLPLATPVGVLIEEPADQWLPRAETALQLTVDEAGKALIVAPR